MKPRKPTEANQSHEKPTHATKSHRKPKAKAAKSHQEPEATESQNELRFYAHKRSDSGSQSQGLYSKFGRTFSSRLK